MHAGKMPAVVTCAAVGAASASITLEAERRHSGEASNINEHLQIAQEP